MMSGNTSNGTILEDDQQLYDWGIENRLDQYYQDDHGGEAYSGAGDQPQFYPRDYSSERRGGGEYPSPPPAHLPPSLDGRRIKEEPGLDMSQWSQPGYSPYYRKMGPSAPPSPANFPPPPFSLDANEALKVERKRARNRIAASKCRMRKIEKIQTLDQQTSTLKAENEELASLAKKLKDQVYKLQQELRWHLNNGCQLSERAAKATDLLTDISPGSSKLTNQIQRPDSTTLSPPDPPETAPR